MARPTPIELAQDLAAAFAAAHEDISDAVATHHVRKLGHQIPDGRHCLVLVGGTDETRGQFPIYTLSAFLYERDNDGTADADAIGQRYAEILSNPPRPSSGTYTQLTVHTHLDPEQYEHGLIIGAATYTLIVPRR